MLKPGSSGYPVRHSTTEQRKSPELVRKWHVSPNERQIDRQIDTLVFNAVFNSTTVISRRPAHLSMLSWNSFNQYAAQYSFQATGYSPT